MVAGKLFLGVLVVLALAGAATGGAYAAGLRLGEGRGRLAERQALQANFQQELTKLSAQAAAPAVTPDAAGADGAGGLGGRGGALTGRAGGGAGFGGAAAGAGAFLAGGLTGTIKSVTEGQLVLTTEAGDITVALTANTVVERAQAGSKTDLKVGSNVSVAGARAEGGIAATTVTVRP